MSYGEPKSKWHKLKYLAPTGMLFLSPWTHRALYENFVLACPGLMSPEAAHGVIWGATAIVWFFTIMWATV